MQCVLVRLTSLLTARATALCSQRLALVYEMLVHIRLVKMTTRESVLLQQVTGKLFILLSVLTGFYILVSEFIVSVIFLQGLGTRSWASQGKSALLMGSAHPWHKPYQLWHLSCTSLLMWTLKLSRSVVLFSFSIEMNIFIALCTETCGGWTSKEILYCENPSQDSTDLGFLTPLVHSEPFRTHIKIYLSICQFDNCWMDFNKIW